MGTKRKHQVSGMNTLSDQLSHEKKKNNLSEPLEKKSSPEHCKTQDTWSRSKKKRMRNKRNNELKRQQILEIDISPPRKSARKLPRSSDPLTDIPDPDVSDCKDKLDRQSNKQNNDGILPGKGRKVTPSKAAPNLCQDNSFVLSAQSTTSSARPKSALQLAFLERLSGSRFRSLNEDLYTTHSSSALKRFQQDPQLFKQYHDGFSAQVKSWPVNPVDVILRWIKAHEKKSREIRQDKTNLVVADFGCGEAKLAKELLKTMFAHSNCSNTPQNVCPFTVHSFDLVANGNPFITACDMSNVPLPNSTVDVGVFCLALMGTNVADFIREAHRVLRPNAILKIAEVRSRFEDKISIDNSQDSGNRNSSKHQIKRSKNAKTEKNTLLKMDSTLLDEFIRIMQLLGFNSTKIDRTNSFFVLMDFVKVPNSSPPEDVSFTPKPCLYKRR